MPFVRTRTTQAGSLSTSLAETYRDGNGKRRYRILANLHGEPDTLSALAKLATRREALRKEQQSMEKEAVHANQFYEIVTKNPLEGKLYTHEERREIDRLMVKRERLLKRMARVDADLAKIQKDGAVIKKYCSATPEEVQDAIQTFKKQYRDVECLVLGMEFVQGEQRRKARAKLRRLSV